MEHQQRGLDAVRAGRGGWKMVVMAVEVEVEVEMEVEGVVVMRLDGMTGRRDL